MAVALFSNVNNSRTTRSRKTVQSAKCRSIHVENKYVRNFHVGADAHARSHFSSGRVNFMVHE